MALYPYLNDTYFLLQVDNMQEKEQFVKITVLDKQEKPIRAIEGQVTSGNLNINGSSAIRRNGSISFVVTNEEEDVPFLQNLFFFNNRIKLEMGFTNTLDKYTEYKTLWFPLGIYIISKPSITNNNSGVNISLTLNDKMVLLDGSAGGTIPSAVDFHEDAYGKPVPFYQCIQELVHHWGGEQLGKIIIENVPEYIDAIVRWGGEEPLNIDKIYEGVNGFCFVASGEAAGFNTWAREEVEVNIYKNQINYNLRTYSSGYPYMQVIFLINGEIVEDTGYITTNSNKWPRGNGTSFSNSYTLPDSTSDITIQVGIGVGTRQITWGEVVTLKRPVISYIYEGELMGKKREVAHFTSDVTSQPGDSVVTILDKIKQQLGNYEYFYDLDGNFVFREKRNYLNTSYSTYLDENLIDLNKNNFIIDMTKGRSIYNFTNSNLITSYSNSPAYDEVKNEFIVWGKKEGNENLPCRYRLVIDSKPICQTHEGIALYQELIKKTDGNGDAVLIPTGDIKALKTYIGENGYPGMIESSFYLSYHDGKYYLYNEETLDWDLVECVQSEYHHPITSQDWREELYYQGIEALAAGVDTGVYFEDLRNEWPKLYDLKEQKIKDIYLNDPLLMDYYLDFIDTNEELSKISVAAIGRRTKAQNADNVNCVFEFNVPEVYFYSEAHDEEYKNMIINHAAAQKAEVIELSAEDYESLKLSSTANDAYTEARAWLYESTQRNSTISISAIPIYYLDANSRITVSDSVSGIQGDFLINSISLPLDISGTMTLSCSQVLQKP